MPTDPVKKTKIQEVITVLFLFLSGMYGFFKLIMAIVQNNSLLAKFAIGFIVVVILAAVGATVYFRM